MRTITDEQVEEGFNKLHRKMFLLIKKRGSDLSNFDDRQLKNLFRQSIKLEEYEISKLVNDEFEKRKIELKIKL